MQQLHFSLQDQSLWLHAHRYIFWEQAEAIIISDLHIGKTGHFRKAGLAMPQALFKEDLQRLFAGIQFYKAKQLIIVGDLFHSAHNKELDVFVRWRESMSQVNFTLVMGNHDILKPSFYTEAGLSVHHGVYLQNGFAFSHDLPKQAQVQNAQEPLPYCFTGHIHPGISVDGIGRQSLKFPCFYFGQTHAVLPAFGAFTGMYLMPKAGAKCIYAVVENRVIRVA